MRFFADRKEAPTREVWYPVPQPLEPVQLMLLLGTDRVLLYRRTGILQLLSKDTADLLAAAKLDQDEGIEGLELWLQDGKVFLLLSDGRVHLVDEAGLSATLVHTLPAASAALTASHLVQREGRSLLSVAAKGLLPTVFSFDGAQWTTTYRAKQPKPDKLGLPVKIDVRSLVLAGDLLVAGLATGMVWISNTRLSTQVSSDAQLDTQTPGDSRLKELYKVPISLLHPLEGDSFVACNSRGSLESYSGSTAARTGGYLGNAGAIVGVAASADLLVSSSLERFVTAYDLATRKPVHKVFLGHAPVAMLVVKVVQPPKAVSNDDAMWSKLSKVRD